LALVCGLAVGDYLLWNWSLSHSHDVPALIAGLTLPPLTIAFLWLIALSAGRLLARTTRRAPARSRFTSATPAGDRRPPRAADAAGTSAGSQQRAPATSTTGSSGKLAA
jgi:hypothetical protein